MSSTAIAAFITPHGFGHAARATAVLAAAQVRRRVRVELFTTAPKWLFAESLTGAARYHKVVVDVGLVQRDPVTADFDATLHQLDRWLGHWNDLVPSLARKLQRLGCRAVLCDVSALGVAAAERAGLPSLLLENFTWDWIYGAFDDRWPGFGFAGAVMAQALEHATVRLQPEPVAHPVPGAERVGPVARAGRMPREEVRRRLEIPDGLPMVLVTMGGVPGGRPEAAGLERIAEAFFVVAGGGRRPRRDGRVLELPERNGIYHPDLVAAADLVVTKAGYSTVAEAATAGTRLAVIPRPAFRESQPLVQWVCDRVHGAVIDPWEWADGSWGPIVERLLAQPRPDPVPPGTGAAARRLLELVDLGAPARAAD